MKNYCLFILFFVLSSCGSKKNQSAVGATLTSECPKDGDCKVEIFDGKAIAVKVSDLGSLYYEMEDNSSKRTIKYTYNRKVKGDLQDATYREEVIFELPINSSEFVVQDQALLDAQLLFGRFCYCKGQTGYYKIEHGSLRAVKDEMTKTTSVNIDFTTKKVPQIISKIAFTIK